MASKDIKIEKIGDIYELSRPQWGDHRARISVYPGLLQKVCRHTWTYRRGEHPYLTTVMRGEDGRKHSVSLHKFVLDHLYGTQRLTEMLNPGMIIEHLDNDGLNCTYTNLHILPEEYNKAKAFTIDKEQGKPLTEIPAFIVDPFNAYKKGYFQMQVTFNENLLARVSGEEIIPVESLYLIYKNFTDLYSDWIRIIKFKQAHLFNIGELRPDGLTVNVRPQFELTEEEKKGFICQRDGKLYLILHTGEDESGGRLFVTRTRYQDIE